MAWAKEIYVATESDGVYYTANFTDPSVQPTWTKVSSGLATDTMLEFHLDPFHQDQRQYVLTGGRYSSEPNILYTRFMGGSWEALITNDQWGAQTMGSDYVGGRIYGFWADSCVDGRLWIVSNNSGHPRSYGALGWGPYNEVRVGHSNDYGRTWIASDILWSGWYVGIPTSIRSCGNVVYFRIGGGVFDYPYIFYSDDRFTNWSWIVTDVLEYTLGGFINPLTPWRFYYDAYYHSNPEKLTYFYSGLFDAIEGINLGYLGQAKFDTMWYNDSDANHMKVVHNKHLYVTYDDWGTMYSPGGVTNPEGYISNIDNISPYAGDNPDYVMLGIYRYNSWEPDAPTIATLYGDNDTTLTHIAGTNWNIYPYVNSIPMNNNPCRCGIQGVHKLTGYVYVNAVAMPEYLEDTGGGVPMEGDRSAWNAKYYKEIHANDIDSGSSAIHHSLEPSLYINNTTGSYKAARGDHSHYLSDLSSGSSSPGEILTSLGSGSLTWSPLSDHSHAGSATGDGGKLEADVLSSGSGGINSVLTNNVSGYLNWEAIDDWRISLVQDENLNTSLKDFVVPLGTEWQILWIWVEYTSTITSGSRQLEVQILDSGSSTISQFQTAIEQDSNLTYKYLFGMVMPNSDTPRNNNYFMATLPSGTYLAEGQKIRIWDNKTIDSSADDMLVRIQYAYHPIAQTYIRRYTLSMDNCTISQTTDNVKVSYHGPLIMWNSFQSQLPDNIKVSYQGPLIMWNSYQLQSSDNIEL